MPITIADILVAAYPEALKVKLDGYGFISPKLRCKQRRGKIIVDPPITYPVNEICTPIIWSYQDETKNPYLYQRINIVAQLLSNALESHDDILLKHMGKGRAVISKEYKYRLSEVVKVGALYSHHYACSIHTAVAFIPSRLPRTTEIRSLYENLELQNW